MHTLPSSVSAREESGITTIESSDTRNSTVANRRLMRVEGVASDDVMEEFGEALAAYLGD